MSILLMLIPLSLLFVGLAVAAFAWAVRRGQFDDLDTAALDILAQHDALEETRVERSDAGHAD